MSRSGGNDPRKARVVCPWFVRFYGSGGRSIVCRGVVPNSETVLSFIDQPALDDHLADYCNTYTYAACPLAQVLEDMQPQEEDS